MDAIVYTSNTGTTKEYAFLLRKHTGLPVCSLNDARGTITDGSEIIYLGWVMAGKVQGYDKAAKRYNIKAVCGVCMGATGSQLKEIRDKNQVPKTTAVFSMQGGFDINKLHGIYKMMMKVMVKTAGKGLADKKSRTEDEDVMLEMMLHGANHVNENNMKELLEWYDSAILAD